MLRLTVAPLSQEQSHRMVAILTAHQERWGTQTVEQVVSTFLDARDNLHTTRPDGSERWDWTFTVNEALDLSALVFGHADAEHSKPVLMAQMALIVLKQRKEQAG